MKGISELIDSDMENAPGFIDENSILSSASDVSTASANRQNAAQKKKKKRPRVTMPKSKTRVTKSSDDHGAKKSTKKPTAAKRKALEEQINRSGDDDRIVQCIEIESKSVKQSGRSKNQKMREPCVEEENEAGELEKTPEGAKPSFAKSRKEIPKVTSRTMNSAANNNKAQANAWDEVDGMGAVDLSDLGPLPPTRPHSRVRTDSNLRKRTGSISDSEKGDPNLRRRLGDITRKFENIDLKYQNLKEIGINEANANMEKLRKQCEATTQASTELINSLKKELAMQGPLANDSRKVKKELQVKEAELERLRNKNAELTSSLSSAQNEIKALQAKLAASRSASVGAEASNSKAPSSIPKSSSQSRAPAVAGEAAQAAQVAQMKEDLYSDLTGLIIRGAKRTEEGDTFDCIQTGRNGSKFWLI